jgi:hypothetical protein
VGDALGSARIKLERANLHAGTARREARRFFDRNPEPTFGIDPEGEPTDPQIGSVFRCKVVVRKGWPDLPRQFAARFGDAIHNYRCVLDHVSWQLVSHGLTPPSTLAERAQRRIQFPVYGTEQAFDQNIAGRLPGVDTTVTDLIKSRHVYVGGQATKGPLLALVALSNDDKHRTLPIIASAILNVHTQVTFERCEPISVRNPPTRPAVKDDAVVTLLECRVRGLNPNVSMKLNPTLHIALEDGAGFGDVLDEIRREVVEILNAPEIVAALS